MTADLRVAIVGCGRMGAFTPPEVRAAMAWEPRVADDVTTTRPPDAEELRLIRDVLDPEGRYTS